MGIVLGGSGQGEQLAANKVHGVRAALCNDLFTARLARAHNDANVCRAWAREWSGSAWPKRSSPPSSPPSSRVAATPAASPQVMAIEAEESRMEHVNECRSHPTPHPTPSCSISSTPRRSARSRGCS